MSISKKNMQKTVCPNKSKKNTSVKFPLNPQCFLHRIISFLARIISSS